MSRERPRDARGPALSEAHAQPIRELAGAAIERRLGRRAKEFEVRVVENAVVQALGQYHDDVAAGATDGYPRERVQRELDRIEAQAEALVRTLTELGRETRQILGLGSRMRNIATYAPADVVAKWCDHPDGPAQPASSPRAAEDELRDLWLRAGLAKKSLSGFTPRGARPPDYAARALAFRSAIIWADLTRVPLGRHIDAPGPLADFVAAVLRAAGAAETADGYLQELASDLSGES